MSRYILRRLLLIVPTLLAIITLNFFIVQTAPGGPVEKALAAMEFGQQSTFNRGEQDNLPIDIPDDNANPYRGSQGLEPEVVAQITQRFGFDKPLYQRYFDLLLNYLCFDFGNSLFKGSSVISLISHSLPVSITLGLWSTLLIYLISIPLGIRKAIKNGSRFDVATTVAIIIGYAIPSFLFAMLLIVFFAGGSYVDWFPLRGLVSVHFEQLNWYQKIFDYLWHICLPVLATVISGFATLTMLTKNAFLDEMSKQYVITAKAKGLSEKAVLYKHIFRNAMLLIIAGFPSAFIGMFFTSSLLIEVIFSLNGLGLLGFEATLQRDYPVIFATLYIFTLIGLLMNIISDLTYTLVDPRIDFEER